MPQKYAKVPPQHVAVIMDGNGRWAKKRLLPRAAGHRAGFRRMLSLVDHIFACGIRYCTLFALSCENLNRPREEIEGLFEIFREYFGKHIAPLVEKGIALRVLGDAALVPPDIAASMREAEKKTSAGKNGVLTVAIGYGGRQDIVGACNRALQDGQKVTLESFAEKLSTGGMPAVDLLIRTGGEKRLSNFLLFECAYAELYFSDKMFPDFSDADFDAALEAYAGRERRYGRIE